MIFDRFRFRWFFKIVRQLRIRTWQNFRRGRIWLIKHFRLETFNTRGAGAAWRKFLIFKFFKLRLRIFGFVKQPVVFWLVNFWWLVVSTTEISWIFERSVGIILGIRIIEVILVVFGKWFNYVIWIFKILIEFIFIIGTIRAIFFFFW